MKEIVIKISEDAYDYLINTHFVENTKYIFNQSVKDRKHTMQLFEVIDAVKNGTPLPKGHGRLIDADALEKKMCDREEELGDDRALWESSAVSVALDMFAPTIIESEEEG